MRHPARLWGETRMRIGFSRARAPQMSLNQVESRARPPAPSLRNSSIEWNRLIWVIGRSMRRCSRGEMPAAVCHGFLMGYYGGNWVIRVTRLGLTSRSPNLT